MRRRYTLKVDVTMHDVISTEDTICRQSSIKEKYLVDHVVLARIVNSASGYTLWTFLTSFSYPYPGSEGFL
jgi:hypothetical protein